ncbi:MAG: hypothetical protein ISR96_01780 [Nitrospira sp.]|nr:hypothetical protein [bacterium]MBL7048246.1 hypothetical protein [Nitrospira sp.]
MDIVAISGPEIPDKSRRLKKKDDLIEVSGAMSQLIDDETHHEYLGWNVQDRVSISREARQKFKDSTL